jgi:hypothetical protein
MMDIQKRKIKFNHTSDFHEQPYTDAIHAMYHHNRKLFEVILSLAGRCEKCVYNTDKLIEVNNRLHSL